MSDDLGEIRQALGRIEQKIDTHTTLFADHVKDDRQAYAAIIQLRETAARQKGFLTAVGVMGSGLGAALGWVLEKTLGIGHH